MTQIDLDEALDRFGKAAAPARLAGLEDAVFAKLHARAAADDAGLSMGAGALAAIGALMLGMTSSVLTAAPRPEPLPSIDSASNLAPSTLLAGPVR